MARTKRKNPNRAGTDARKRKDGRYETRATLNTTMGRRQVSFYGNTAEEANNKKFQALADQAKGILFSDPNPASRVKKAVKSEQAPMRSLFPGRGFEALRSRCGTARRGPANPRAQDWDAPG